MGVFVEFKFPNDRELFTLISGLVTGFAGAFLMRVKPQSKSDEVPPGTTQVESVSIAKTPVTPAVEEVAK
jgi:formylglycine-generating enzyme required for sulfatase activity